MPVVHRFGPYRCYFYSHEYRDSFEAPHIHVGSSSGTAAFWLEPVSLRNSRGNTPREIHQIRQLVKMHGELLLRHWEGMDEGVFVPWLLGLPHHGSWAVTPRPRGLADPRPPVA